MITAVIVDDEQQSIDILVKLFKTVIFNVKIIGTCGNVKDAHSLISDLHPDLVFLDIEMGSSNGFDLLEQIGEINFHLIFVTAYEEFALKAIKFSALDYILKPVNIEELKQAINRIEEKGRQVNEGEKVKQMFRNILSDEMEKHKISLPVSDGYEFIQVADILYCRADGSYTNFYLKNSRKLTISKNLKYYSEILSDYGFCRIHSGTLINFRFIKKFGKAAGGFVVMEDGNELSVSNSRRTAFLDLIDLGRSSLI